MVAWRFPGRAAGPILSHRHLAIMIHLVPSDRVGRVCRPRFLSLGARRVRRRFRFHRKKRGDRVSGSARLASYGEAGFFAACLVLGAVALVLIVAWVVIPQWRVNRHFAKTTCRITSVLQRMDSEMTVWQPTVTYEYEVLGERYQSNAYDLLDTRYAQRKKAEKFRDLYQVGEKYPCWYDPRDPKTAVLLRGNPLAYWLLLLPVAFLAIGIGGLGYTIWQFGASRERRSAMAQRAPGKEIFDDGEKDKVEFPAIPRDTDVTNSPGTTLAYRLPIAVTASWQLFAAAMGCLCWNGLVALFAFLAVRKHLSGQPDWALTTVVIPFAVAGVWLVVNLVRQFWRSRIGPTRIEISDHPLEPGKQVELFVVQTGKMIVEQLELVLVCEEEATYRQGTDTITEAQAVVVKSIMVREDVVVGPGQPYEERCTLAIPAEAMHSFRGINNSIVWRLSVRARVANRPGYERQFPVMVVPRIDDTPLANGDERA